MNEPLALVYSMHKVGSSTIMNAIRSIGYIPGRGYPENLHDLNPLDQWEKFITLVRDPIARNISYFFESRQPTDKRWLPEVFLKETDHHYPLRWFDEWPLYHFGDVLDQPFSRKKGWQIYDDLLLIRTESIMDGLQDAFTELFDLPEGTIVSVEHRAETTLTRPYGRDYQDFLDNVKIPEYLLDEIYGSRFMEHFYYKKEIAEFRKRWS